MTNNAGRISCFTALMLMLLFFFFFNMTYVDVGEKKVLNINKIEGR